MESAMTLINLLDNSHYLSFISWHMNQDVTNDQVNPRKIWESILTDIERVL